MTSSNLFWGGDLAARYTYRKIVNAEDRWMRDREAAPKVP
jgi:hypothetical protein